MLRRARSTLVLQESTSLLIKKDSSSIISTQESNNMIAVKPTFKLGGGSLKTSSKMSNSIFSSPSTYSQESNNFLKACGLCRKKLSPLKNIYMYGGDQGFCSDNCRCRKIMIEELLMEEILEETTDHELVSTSTYFSSNAGNGLPRRNHVPATA
ncbi:hypothetical protein MKW94_005064 [Papaver nudicaule]|uniref:FLZ-type domain-containing protein n=1 Tax=Papaver nudicaule TaxID=74823 RepID=A0AA41VDS7_PAPNU|nr:hypothetical protein [Papaver nudicaule]